MLRHAPAVRGGAGQRGKRCRVSQGMLEAVAGAAVAEQYVVITHTAPCAQASKSVLCAMHYRHLS
jgi:hypothetical protein